MSNCTALTGHLPGSDHRAQECPTYHDQYGEVNGQVICPGCDQEVASDSICEQCGLCEACEEYEEEQAAIALAEFDRE